MDFGGAQAISLYKAKGMTFTKTIGYPGDHSVPAQKRLSDNGLLSPLSKLDLNHRKALLFPQPPELSRILTEVLPVQAPKSFIMN